MNPTDSIVCKFSHADCKSDCDQPTANSFDLAPPNPSKPTGDQPYKTLSPPTHAIDTWSIAGKLEGVSPTCARTLDMHYANSWARSHVALTPRGCNQILWVCRVGEVHCL